VWDFIQRVQHVERFQVVGLIEDYHRRRIEIVNGINVLARRGESIAKRLINPELSTHRVQRRWHRRMGQTVDAGGLDVHHLDFQFSGGHPCERGLPSPTRPVDPRPVADCVVAVERRKRGDQVGKLIVPMDQFIGEWFFTEGSGVGDHCLVSISGQ